MTAEQIHKSEKRKREKEKRKMWSMKTRESKSFFPLTTDQLGWDELPVKSPFIKFNYLN